MSTKSYSETKTFINISMNGGGEEPKMNEKVTPKGVGCLDMVIAFDTTGSMSAYIDDVRRQVRDMIPRLFKDNENLQLGIVAFGDYCDMDNKSTFGDAYQCMPLTNNENDLISFVMHARNTSGGDGDEFYELVLQKIIDEMPWRDEATKAILLIADANPHELGYSYRDCVVNNQVDWRAEARKAAAKMIKIDTVSICGLPWYRELSAMTNGICVPFKSSGNTSAMIETATTARNAMAFARSGAKGRVAEMRSRMSSIMADHADAEMGEIYTSYCKELDELDS